MCNKEKKTDLNTYVNHSIDNSRNCKVASTLNIVLVTETWVPEINGVANSVYQLVEGLINQGNQVTLVRPKPLAYFTSSVQKEVFVKAHTIPNYTDMQYGHPELFKLFKLFKKVKPDVVHIVTEGPLGLTALLASRLCEVPVSSGYHSQFDDFSDHLGYKKLVKPITSYLNWFHNRCDLTCVPSQKSYDQLAAHGIKNLHIVGRGVDTNKFNPKHRNDELRASWGATKQTTVLMYVGRVSPEKNIELSIQSYYALKEQQPNRNCKMVVIGEGPALQELKHTYKDVIFTGAKVGTELSQHFASGDAFIFASEVETFGNVVTEAMASGLSVVAYHDAAAAKYVTSELGWTVTKSDATSFKQQVANLPELKTLRKKGKLANQTMLQLGWDTPVQQFYDGFQKAITNKHIK